jgi:ribosomal protein L19
VLPEFAIEDPIDSWETINKYGVPNINGTFLVGRYPKRPIVNQPSISVGDKVKVGFFQRLDTAGTMAPKKMGGEGKKRERLQFFDGVVISKRPSRTLNSSMITVRKTFRGGFGVEKVFSRSSPWVASVEVVRRSLVRRSKLYYLRGRSGKGARLRPLPSRK